MGSIGAAHPIECVLTQRAIGVALAPRRGRRLARVKVRVRIRVRARFIGEG